MSFLSDIEVMIQMLTEHEIYTQPDDFERLLAFLNDLYIEDFARYLFESDVVYFVGCGSSYYLAVSASKYFSRVTGIDAKPLQSGEVTFASSFVLGSRDLKRSAVLISRSGDTTETVQALRKFNQMGIKTFGITLGEKSELRRICQSSLVLPLEERSVVMTKSFSCMLLSLFYLIDRMAKIASDYDRLVRLSRKFLHESEKSIESQAIDGAKHYVFLGTGVYEGIAKESALKLQEMSLTFAEAYSTFEYRHGPKSLVTDQTLVVLYASDQNPEEVTLLGEMQRLGASTVLRTPAAENGQDAFLQVLFGQLLGLIIAKRKGLNPDQPRNLSRVVFLADESR
ncbi:MAG: Sugar isomerase (SIS) [Thermotoga sp. 50_1627]|nr:MAG: Sugar isomerase (SIS) [Thermotoga sp. 50_64]KUK24588.1 MAG: Sugar isomerase (SIS) [Thermotoga sp. 50_1627]HBT39431.1 iron dicitrate transport regulator FecR [Pseudothermotoga sp.]HCO97176.1 iron dicitrate transport regulator FecR [Pseudothermotoga sp.]